MPWTRFDLTLALALPLGIGLSLGASEESTPSRQYAGPRVAAVSFEADVMPILEERCVTCHGGIYDGEERLELLLDLRSYEGLMAGSEYGSVVEPGDPVESLLIVMIEDGEMPEEGDPVTPEELDVLRSWIADGAENNE